ncbi:MAG TPA: helix-turn-helix domain-containing protein [Thermoleophilaceae bacterium]|nr:helix-turn-helix domain-containing protein [Thermoleophilaceae bacterium]
MSSAQGERPIKRRMRAPARRAEVLGAAVECFARSGYRATSMGEIAARADVARPVLYDHFPSKKALFLEVLEEQSAAFLADAASRISGEGDARERMRQTVAAVFAFAHERPDSWRLLFGNTAHGDPEIDAAAAAAHRNRVVAVAALLAEDARNAGIDPAGPRAEAMVEMLIAALRGGAEWGLARPGVAREDLVEAALDLLWTGLGNLR